MEIIRTPGGLFQESPFESEADLEAAISEIRKDLFGENRIYLNQKRLIGKKGGLQNIPDGYLIDLSGRTPRLLVVENEIASHDPLRHIAAQVLEFSISFSKDPIGSKKTLLACIQQDPEVLKRCTEFASKNSTYRNLDHLLEDLVSGDKFAALVIIDEMSEDLEDVLLKRLNFPVDVLSLKRFRNEHGQTNYVFEPYLSNVIQEPIEQAPYSRRTSAADISDLDTVVIPAQEDGFQETYIGENQWYYVRLHGSMRAQIKWCAAYRVAPISAITHIAPVKSIGPSKVPGKVVIYFSEPAKEIRHIPLVTKEAKGRIKPPQSLRYANREKLLAAKNLDELW